MGKLFGQVKGLIVGVFTHWNKPGAGRYVANKEIAAYSVGGMGVQFISAAVGQVALSANCLLLGSIFQLTAFELTTLLTINTLVTIFMQPLKSYLIDNVGGKHGKARPFILWLGPPSAILFALIPFIPRTWSHMTILICVGVVFVLANFVYQFYFGMYGQLSQLMTPNSTERADIITVSSLIYSFAPTLTGFFFPLISKAINPEGAQGQLDIRFYQIIMPVFALVGMFVGLFAYFGTKERIVVAKNYQAKVKFKDGMKQVIKSKYFWIINVSSWSLFARGAISMCMGWAYIYILQDAVIQSFVTLIMGTASGIGMAITPLIVRKFGKRNTVIASNLLFGAASCIMIFLPGSFVAFSISTYLMFFSAATQIITAPAMNADALDYLQWKSGRRLEGLVGNLGIIGSIIGIGTNYVIPAIYNAYGLTSNYDVLYDETVRNPMFRMLAIISAIASVLYCIPYLFWDLSEKKQALIIEDLKNRALEENKQNGQDDGSFLSSDEIMDNIKVESKEELDKEFAKEGINEDGTFAIEEGSLIEKLKFTKKQKDEDTYENVDLLADEKSNNDTQLNDSVTVVAAEEKTDDSAVKKGKKKNAKGDN